MIPTYDQFVEPLLRYLAEHPEGAVTRDTQEALADRLGLTDEQRAISLPSGVQAMYKNRIGWPHDRLKRAGLSGSPKRGFWQLTSEGVAFAKANPAPLAPPKLDELTAVDRKSRLRPASDAPPHPLHNEAAAPVPQPETESPDDRLVRALDEISDAVAAELLEVIGHAMPQFFEILLLDLLHAMGAATSSTSAEAATAGSTASSPSTASASKKSTFKQSAGNSPSAALTSKASTARSPANVRRRACSSRRPYSRPMPSSSLVPWKA